MHANIRYRCYNVYSTWYWIMHVFSGLLAAWLGSCEILLYQHILVLADVGRMPPLVRCLVCFPTCELLERGQKPICFHMVWGLTQVLKGVPVQFEVIDDRNVQKRTRLCNNFVSFCNSYNYGVLTLKLN